MRILEKLRRAFRKRPTKEDEEFGFYAKFYDEFSDDPSNRGVVIIAAE